VVPGEWATPSTCVCGGRRRGFGDGSTMNVYDTALGRLGAVICWENLMPAARMAMYRVADFPTDHERPYGDDPETIVSRGGSSIIGPLGQVLAGPVYDDEALLVADLDMAELARAKYDLDVAGHYSRPDVFQLHVNWSPQRALTPRSTASHGGPAPAASA